GSARSDLLQYALSDFCVHYIGFSLVSSVYTRFAKHLHQVRISFRQRYDLLEGIDPEDDFAPKSTVCRVYDGARLERRHRSNMYSPLLEEAFDRGMVLHKPV